MFKIRGKKAFFVLTFLFLIGLPLATFGAVVKSPDNVYVEADQMIDDNFIRAGKIVEIRGTVNGDVIAMGNAVNIKGRVLGDVIAIGRSVDISGDVAGNVRVAGSDVKISGRVARNVNILASAVSISDSAYIGKDLLLCGGDAKIGGQIYRHIKGKAANVVLSGKVEGDVDLGAYNKLTLASGAEVGGNLYSSSVQKTKIEEGALMKNPIIYRDQSTETKDKDLTASSLIQKLISLFGLVVTGLVIVFLSHKKVLTVTYQMLKKPWLGLGWGAVCFIATPVILFFLAFSIIGIPLALIGLFFYAVILYVTEIFVGLALGQLLLKWKWLEKIIIGKDDIANQEINTTALVYIMILGVTIFIILTSLPFVGRLFYLLSIWWALGGMVQATREGMKNKYAN